MANERTFSAWMGTGLGAVGVAIGLKAVFGAFDPTWVAKAVASLFLGVAILIYWLAQRQACKTLERLTETDAEAMPSKNFSVLAMCFEKYSLDCSSVSVASIFLVMGRSSILPIIRQNKLAGYSQGQYRWKNCALQQKCCIAQNYILRAY